MPIKMYDLMWKDLRPFIELPANLDKRSGVSSIYNSVLRIMKNIEEKHTYISQPEAIELFQTSKRTLAHLRDDWGMPYVIRGGPEGSQHCQFFYKEEEVRTHLEELRGKK